MQTEQKVLKWTGVIMARRALSQRASQCPQPLPCAQGRALGTRAKGWFVFDVPVTHLLSNLVISLI